MLINFTKMHGLGNDFVIIDLITQSLKLHTNHIKRIANRHLGIGCDQVLLIEPPTHSIADFFFRIFNANGQEVEQCGNGARCAARFFYDMGFSNHCLLLADCLAGSLKCKIEEDDNVTINMGFPIFTPKDIPFKTHEEAMTYSINIENTTFSISALSMGNPHAIIETTHLDSAPVKKIGPLISKHASFSNETNVSFMQIIDRTHIRLRVYERGIGETLACGSAACASVVSGIRAGQLDSPTFVIFPQGTLKITWHDLTAPVYMTGKTHSIFIGRFRL
jgi:diaminopimelate epimerase